MDSHGIEVLDGADDDAVVALVPDHLHLELLPAEQGLVDEQFVGGRKVEPAPADLDELVAVVGDAPAAAAEGERRPDDAREPDPALHLQRFLEAVRDGRARRGEPDAIHGLDEPLPVLGLVDGILAGADQLDAEGGRDAFADQVERAVQRRLAAHRRQQGIRTFGLDDLRHGAPFHGLDVGRVGHGGIGHDRGRVGVDQHHPVALVLQRLARLCAGIVELAGLADDDRTGTENQHGLDIRAFACSRHQPLRLAGLIGDFAKRSRLASFRRSGQTGTRSRADRGLLPDVPGSRTQGCPCSGCLGPSHRTTTGA